MNPGHDQNVQVFRGRISDHVIISMPDAFARRLQARLVVANSKLVIPDPEMKQIAEQLSELFVIAGRHA